MQPSTEHHIILLDRGFFFFFESMFIVLQGVASRWTLHLSMLLSGQFCLYLLGHPQLLCRVHPK